MSVPEFNDTIVVKTNDDKCQYIVRAGYDQKIGKNRYNLKVVSGEPFGATFSVDKKRKIYRIDADEDCLDDVVDAQESVYDEFSGGGRGDGSCAVDSGATGDSPVDSNASRSMASKVIRGDNSGYVDTNTAQKMTSADVIRMREEGLSGKEIISRLKENNSTFASKTEFAQAKWVKRKAAKHDRKLVVFKPTPMSLAEVNFQRNRDKLGSLRADSLAQVLAQAGVRAGSRVLVVDSTVGLVVGAVAYRLRGHGRILAAYGAQQPHFDIVNNFNLDAKSISLVQPVGIACVGPAARYVCKHGFHPPNEVDEVQQQQQQQKDEGEEEESEEAAEGTAGPPAEALLATVAMGDSKRLNRDKEKEAQQYPSYLTSTGRSFAQQKRIWYWLRQGIDSLVICSRYHPLPILKQSLLLLEPSSPFVVFHEFLDPLVECYMFLQQLAEAGQPLALRLQITENWLRDFQTLPGRFRPDMFMSSNGGFVLSGIYVGTVVAEGGGEPPYPLSAPASTASSTGYDLKEVPIDGAEHKADSPFVSKALPPRWKMGEN